MTLCGAVVLLAPGLSAQSATTGELTGTVRTEEGLPVPRALVTVTSEVGARTRALSTNNSGAFRAPFLDVGAYELRVEAIGYRPLVARLVSISEGRSTEVTLRLVRVEPPVVAVDTLFLGAGASSRFVANGRRLGVLELQDVPHRYDDLASVVALSSAFDDALGSQGLPGTMTLVVADGLPFYRAPHPTARSELLSDALFPPFAVSEVSALDQPPDLAYAGGAGGSVAVSTYSAAAGTGPEIEGLYAGDPTWSSSELDLNVPTLASFQAGARGPVSAEGGTSRITLAGQALRHQAPLAPRVGDGLAGDLSALDAAVLSTLTEPAVETYARFGGLARLDVEQGATGRLFGRALASYATREIDGTGAAPLGPGWAPPEESLDLAVGGGGVRELSPSAAVELRIGASGSFRDFASATSALPPAYLATAGAFLGEAPSAVGESSRIDVVVTPVFRHAVDNRAIRVGAWVRASRFRMAHSPGSQGDLFFSGPAELSAGTGFGLASSAPETSFATRELGGFVAYETALGPGLEVSFGGRVDLETLGGVDVDPDSDWLAASGLANDDFDDALPQFGVQGRLTWDPSGRGGSLVDLTWSIRSGDVDPRLLYELASSSDGATTTRYGGDGLDWPSSGVPATATDLPTRTLFGPDMRAPRTSNVALTVTRPLGGGTSAFARASLRRTDFLARRRNLNLPLVPRAVDRYGRDVFGTLEQSGAVVGTTADDGRRFPTFGEVWALDPDGWSEYRGVTAGFEHVRRDLEIFGSYTYSSTTDNWTGAASGSPSASLPPGLPEGPDEWSEGTSDFDVPHRASFGATARLGRAALTAAYRFSSGIPFTPGYRGGVDANGDGSGRNDVAFVPDEASTSALFGAWPCLEDQVGGFAERNSCRGPDRHGLTVRLRIGLGEIGGRSAELLVDGIDLVETSSGVIDDALLLVDPTAAVTTSADGSVVDVPVTVNPGFGQVVYPSSRGRLLRFGLRIGR